MPQRNEIIGIFYGIMLLLGMDIIAIITIVKLGIVFSSINSSYGFYAFVCLLMFSLTQLLYVIPVAVMLKRQQRWGMMKGVIIGAIITAFLNGGWLALIVLMLDSL